MYKIYVNDHPLILAESVEIDRYASADGLVLPYMGDQKLLLSCLDKLEKTQRSLSIIVHSDNIRLLKKDFRSLFKKIKAAGGLVFDEHEKVLFIYRLQRWDLPKGKMDKNETRRQTALREVEEETGLPCSILSKVSTTRHTYRLENGKRVLKTTKWYKMNALHNQLKLQYSEYIEDAKWMIPTTFLDSGLPTYASIKDAVAGVISG